MGAPPERTPWFRGVMGILNVTPDSFSDGGRWQATDDAVAHGLALAAAGASWIDVGGESTRPGAQRVPEAEQIRRVVPVIRALRESCHVPVSVDTTRTAVAAAALEAGASIINDVASGDEGDTMSLAAERGCGVVLMHRLTTPDRDAYSDRYDRPPEYGDVVESVCEWLEARALRALRAGVARESVWVDPGLGFGKSVEQNFELLDRLGEVAALGFPVLVSISRKSFVGARWRIERPEERDDRSVELAVEAVRRGAAVIRAHDVAAHVRALAAMATP